MTTLKFMEQQPLDPALVTCSHCGEEKRIGVHSHKERRYICHSCTKTFAETTGTISDKFYSGKAGRPSLVPWSDLHIVQVVKQRRGYTLSNVSRRLVHGCLSQAYDLIAMFQVGLGKINTVYIERLNATFRARMPALVRRTRSLARTTERIETDLFWTGSVYNFCTVHTSLEATPAMAAGLTDHIWSVEELLRLKLPIKSLHEVV